VNNYEQLVAIEAGIAHALRSVPGLTEVIDHEPLGVLPEGPVAYIRWLGPAEILDAETGGGQDVTHAWRLEVDVDVDLDDPEQSQLELKEIVQGVTLAFRESPRLVGAGDAPLVDVTRLELSSEAEYFRRATLTGEAQGPALYGVVFRLEADVTEYTTPPPAAAE